MPKERSLTTDDVVRILRERDPDTHPVVTSTYVAEAAGVTRPTALDRLNEALEEGRVKRATIGQANGWWLKDDPITAERARELATDDSENNTEDHVGAVVQADGEKSPEAGTDGGGSIVSGQVREDVLGVVEKFEEDMARVSVEAMTLTKIDFREHVRNFVMGAIATILGFAVFLSNQFFSIPQLAIQMASGAFFVGVCILVFATYGFFSEYTTAYRESESESSTYDFVNRD